MSLYSQLFLRETGSPYGDITRNSTLSFKDLDQNFIFLKERDINQLRVDGSNLIYETLGGTEYSVNIGGASTGATDTFVTGFTFNTGTNILTIKQNESQSDLTTNLSSLASDVYVLSGNYNPTTGDVTYTISTGGTFVVSGFTTGMTDTFVTGGTLTGTNLVLEKSNGVDTSTIDLSSLGDTYAIVGSYLDERVARWNSTTNTLQNGLIRDDGSTVSIGGGPSASNTFFVDNTSLTVSILGQTQDGNNNQTHAVRAINKNGSASNNVYATGILAESQPTGTPTGGLYIAGRFIQGNFSEFATSGNIELTGLQIEVDTTTSSDEIYGIKIDKIDINNAVSGDVYGIKLNPYTGAGAVSGTKYGIYQEGTDKNYFGGQLQLNTVGGTTPVTNLGVDASGNVVSGTTGGGGGVSFGADMQIPFTNAGGSDFDYTSNFIFDDVTDPTLTITSNGTNPDVLKLEHSTSTGNYYTRISNYGNIEGKHNLLSWDLLSQDNGMFLRTTSALNMYLRTNSTVDNLTLFTNGNASIGDYLYNTARLNIKGAGNDSSTSSFYIKDSDDSKIFEVKDDGTVVIPNIGSTTPVTNLGVDASGNVVSGTTGGGGGSGLNYITSGDTVANNLELTSNWDINGVYTGTTATGAQADCHVDSDYWFTCVATDTWIRLIRG